MEPHVGSARVCSRTDHNHERRGAHADVAQLVERNLAKVEVASSNLVVRSERVAGLPIHGGVAERRGNGLQIRLRGFKSLLHLEDAIRQRAIGAAVARFPDTEEVTGSIPVSPTSKKPQVKQDGPPARWVVTGTHLVSGYRLRVGPPRIEPRGRSRQAVTPVRPHRTVLRLRDGAVRSRGTSWYLPSGTAAPTSGRSGAHAFERL